MIKVLGGHWETPIFVFLSFRNSLGDQATHSFSIQPTMQAYLVGENKKGKESNQKVYESSNN